MHDDTIIALTKRRIDLARQAGPDWQFAESLKELSEGMAQEYAGRALVELIQNGHDALGPGGRGRIQVVLDLRGPSHGEASGQEEHATLYVANEGAGFTEDNFRRIIEVGLSGKGPGEGIGNKGLGFRSVLQLTDWPEIHSVSVPGSGVFDGFSFRFATPDDVHDLVADTETAAWVSAKVSPLALPVPAAATDPVLGEFAAQGFSTVVRLPLYKEGAVAAARAQVEQLVHTQAPLLLFLDRITALTVEVRSGREEGDGAETTKRHVLSRTERQPDWDPAVAGDWVTEVNLADGGRYLLARRTVAADALHTAIERSVSADEIHTKWQDWHGDTWVGVALRLDDDLTDGQMYTFLPMGTESGSQFPGHAHAPFFTKMARTHLNEAVALNAFLLDELAVLCIDTARHLRTFAPRALAVRLVPDVVCWADPGRLDAAASGALADEPVVPLADADNRSGTPAASWGSLRESFAWPDEGVPWKAMTATALAGTGAPIADPAVGAVRQRRIDDLHKHLLGTAMRARADTKAVWAERLAAALRPDTTAPVGGEWADFYDDLARALPSGQALALRGHSIVLNHNGELCSALSGESDTLAAASGVKAPETVFFAPQESGTGAMAGVPSDLRALRRRIVFTHPDIPWRPAGRGCLQLNRLIRAYEPAHVLDALRELLAQKPTNALCRDALAYVFRQYPSLDQAQRDRLPSIGFQVPLRDGGWAQASDALMSPAWGTEGAGLLAQFLEAGATTVPELDALTRRFVAAPEDWASQVADQSMYSEFLLAIGVRDGIPLDTVGLPACNGHELQPQYLARRFPLTEGVRDAWVRDVRAQGWRAGGYPNTPYSFDRELSHLPGIAAVTELGATARRVFTELVLHGLRTWPEDALQVRARRHLERHRRDPDPHTWPTPVASFLRHMPWLPVEHGAVDGPAFVAPERAWFNADGDLPGFVPQLSLAVRRRLDEKPTLGRLRSLGLRLWEEPADAAAAVRDLGTLLADGHVSDRHVVRFKRHYQQAWHHVAGSGKWPWEKDEPVRLAVVRAGALRAWSAGANEDAEREGAGARTDDDVCVIDEDTPLKATLAELAGHPVLVTAPEHGRDVARLLTVHGGLTVRRLSATDIQIRDQEGELIEASHSGRPLLTDDRPWLLTLVALILELKSGAFARQGEARLHGLLEVLSAVCVARTDHVAILVSGAPAPPPPSTRSLALPHPQCPTVVVWAGDDGRTELQACAPALAQLLGRPGLRDPLELALMKMQRHLGDTPPDDLVEVDDDTLAYALDTTADKVAEVRRGLAGELTALVGLLRPVLVCMAGPDRAAAVDEALRRARSQEALLNVVDRYRSPSTVPAAEVLALAHAHRSLSELRDALALDFRALNEALTAIGPPYRPLTHPDLHEHAFADFVRTHRPTVIERLREHYAPLAAGGADVSGYVRARRLDELAPDPGWLTLHRTPPEEAMRTYVAAWLRTHGAHGDLTDAPPPQGSTLKPLEELRAANAAALTALVPALVPLVQAWCHARSAPLPPVWLRGPLMHAKDGLDRSGLADLLLLTEAQLLGSVSRTLDWPTGMPLTTDPARLGVTPELLATVASPHRSSGQAAAPAATITIGSSEVHVGPDRLAEVAELAHRSIDEAFLDRPAQTRLTLVTPAAGVPAPRSSDQGFVVSRTLRATDEEREAIGVVGEVLARAWLQRKYGTVHWRSGYAALLGTSADAAAASDSHGYDFEVPWRNTTLFYEVKALSGSWPGSPDGAERTYEFDLGPSEHRTASAHATTTRYRILLVASALDPTARCLYELPNPLSPKGRDHFRIVGHGLRLRCTPC